MCSSASSRRLGLVVSILLMLRASDAQVPSDTLVPEGHAVRGLQTVRLARQSYAFSNVIWCWQLQTQLMGDEQDSDLWARREQPSVAQESATKSDSSNLRKVLSLPVGPFGVSMYAGCIASPLTAPRLMRVARCRSSCQQLPTHRHLMATSSYQEVKLRKGLLSRLI